MEVDIIAVYYGMSVDRSVEILRNIRLVMVRRYLPYHHHYSACTISVRSIVSNNVDNRSGLHRAGKNRGFLEKVFMFF